MLLFMSKLWDYVSELWTVATNGPIVRSPADTWILWDTVGLYWWENWRTLIKTCPSTTLSTTNSIWTDLGVNLGLRGERLVTEPWHCRNIVYAYGSKSHHIVPWRKRVSELNKSHSMKMTSFWDIALCSLVEVDQCFGDAYCLRRQGNDHTCHRENLKSHKSHSS
jgi:hypothetical protein